MTTVGGLLRERRVALGFSQEALAEAVGVSSRSVNRWEQGGAVPHPDYRRRLAHLLGIDPGGYVVYNALGMPWPNQGLIGGAALVIRLRPPQRDVRRWR